MRRFCFTVDLDRDVNVCVPGRRAAGSLDRGRGDSPRFSSSAAGLQALVGILDDLGMPCTFFCEGRTLERISDRAGLLDGFEVGLHGYDHEDLSVLPYADVLEILRKGRDAVRDVTGRDPVCFRAPYMKPPAGLERLLAEVGIRTDSSLYADASDAFPRTEGGLSRLPVTEGKDASGRKMTGYLWPMHEGGRPPADYTDLFGKVAEGGTFVLGDHTWHMCESRAGGVLGPEDAARTAEDVRTVLGGIRDAGAVLSTVTRACMRTRIPCGCRTIRH